MNTTIDRFSPEILHKAKHIKLLALDVDGILSDGQLLYSDQHQEIKAFCTQDGLGIKLLQQNDIRVAIITGRTSNMVERRAQELSIDDVIQGRDDKISALTYLKDRYQLNWEQVAYMGDDLPDLSAIQQAQLGLSVPNGHPYVRQHADWVTSIHGGQGAVREACDLILHAQNKLTHILEGYTI